MRARACVLGITSIFAAAALSFSAGVAEVHAGAAAPHRSPVVNPAANVVVASAAAGAATVLAPPAAEELVPYRGPVEHIFFHPLIAYPDRAFKRGKSTARDFNDWFVTVPEFDKIVDALYQDGFVLVDIHEMYESKDVQGKTVVSRKPMLLPKGKKPLILSVDDMSYYDYMVQGGTVTRLVLDDAGHVATLSVDATGRQVISRDNEIVPILDRFVEQHPDFSFHGAKGLIALTGFQGILGYRTNRVHSPTYAQDRAAVLRVIQRMKDTGWTFASHGYGHLDAATVSDEVLAADTAHWREEVGSLVGDTDVYVYPYGSAVRTGSAKLQSLLDAGFTAICAVGPTSGVEWTRYALLQDRRHIDGISLHGQRRRLLDLFDADTIIDSVRPDEY